MFVGVREPGNKVLKSCVGEGEWNDSAEFVSCFFFYNSDIIAYQIELKRKLKSNVEFQPERF